MTTRFVWLAHVLRHLILASALLTATALHADWGRTQSIALQKGWNSVYLEVSPALSSPDEAFAELPVDLVATYYPTGSSVQFIQDPDEQIWKRAGWHKWIPPGQSDAFLTNLYRLSAGHSYLIYASEETTWQVKGDAAFSSPNWNPNGFTLIGFPVDPDAPPTFSEYFAGSAAHQDLLAYRLSDNHWIRVESPATTQIEPNQAYWIYSRGDSAYAGPLSVVSQSGDVLDFQSLTETLKLQVINNDIAPLVFDLRSKAGSDGGARVPMVLEQRNPLGTEYLSDISLNPDDSLDVDAQTVLYLTVRRDLMQSSREYRSLLEVKGGGMLLNIPVAAVRP